MLKFFRRIRREFLNEGYLIKYLAYAMGEILLVVIGILIALQINNWNERRIESRLLKSHLGSLAQAVEHDIRELSISLEFNEFRYHSWQYLLEMSGISLDSFPDMPRPDFFIEDEVWEKPYPDTVNKDFIDLVMPHLNYAFLGFVFNMSAINEINNLGILSAMEDDSLKNMINEYYYHLEWKFGDQLVNKRYETAADLKNYFRDEFAISCNFPSDPQEIIDAIRGDKKVVILIKDLIKVANNHYWDIWELRERARILVERINR